MATSNKLPKGFTIDDLTKNWDLAVQAYTKALKRMKLLDATDRNKLWEALNAQFPAYQILPDTNHVSYVKSNLLASLYTIGKSATLLPTTQEDAPSVEALNTWLMHHWDMAGVRFYQMQAGERAALMNIGITQVGWDNELSGGTGDYFFQGAVAYKNIDPTKFMRDPYAESLDTAGFCITWEDLHVSVLRSNPLYAATLDKALEETQSGTTNAPTEMVMDRPTAGEATKQKEYRRLIIHYVRDGAKFHTIHTLDNKSVLYVNEDYKPSCFPFAVLYSNLPAGDIIGSSECAKIFSNSVAYNLMNSIALTAEYKNQRPPKFVSNASGLNIASFVKHGNEADRTFVVSGEASKAVHYHEYPTLSPIVPKLMEMLGADVKSVTGVDERYTGKDTGSILTTGGIESAMDSATLIDAPKIVNYEMYAKKLTQLTLANMLHFSPKRKYLIKDAKTDGYKEVEINFPKINDKTVFQYNLNITSELPKNKTRISQMANALMEKQMQYQQTGQQVDLITPEEWLMMQDLPIREYMQTRMGIQRSMDYTEKVSRVLFGYAGLVQKGVDPKAALALTAADLQASERPGQPGAEEMAEAMAPEMDGGMPAQQPVVPPMGNPMM